MPESLVVDLPDAGATERLGERIAAGLATLSPASTGLCLWLEGDLGAGKTTLVRGLLRSLGHTGRVPSPTYTLVEPYDLPPWQVHHADLYRLRDPFEAEELGLAELVSPGMLLLVEWPGQGRGHLPNADLVLLLEVAGSGRQARLSAVSGAGDRLLRALS